MEKKWENPVTQTAELVCLLAVLATAQLVREGKHSEMKGALQQVSFPASPKCEPHSQRSEAPQLQFPSDSNVHIIT